MVYIPVCCQVVRLDPGLDMDLWRYQMSDEVD